MSSHLAELQASLFDVVERFFNTDLKVLVYYRWTGCRTLKRDDRDRNPVYVTWLWRLEKLVTCEIPIASAIFDLIDLSVILEIRRLEDPTRE